MSGDAQNVKIGAAWVTYGGTDLGYTQGGIGLTIETITREVMVDDQGPLPQAVFSLGKRVTVTVPMAESNYTKLVSILNGSGRNITHSFGTNLFSNVHDLVVTSKNDPTDYFTVKNALVTGQVSTRINFNSERIWAVSFTGYGDATNVLTFTNAS